MSIRTPDALLTEVKALFAPVLASASEKGDLLAARMRERFAGAPEFDARGLADALRRLRKRFSDAEIADCARALAADLERDYCCRERVK